MNTRPYSPYTVDVNVAPSPSYNVDIDLDRAVREVPAGGTIGQILQRVTEGYAWQDLLKVYTSIAELPIQGLTTVLYYTTSDNKLYRYNGTNYVVINEDSTYTFTNNNNKLQLIRTINGVTTVIYEIDLAKFGISATSVEINNVIGSTGNIQTQINNEQSARTAADTALQTNINTEASTRSSADIDLSNRITSEAATRAQNDTTLQNNINAEASTRGAKDTELETSIDDEIERAVLAETTLITNLSNEVTRAQGAENLLTTNLATEVTNRENADTALGGRITNEASTRASADTALSTSINNEVIRAKAKEAVLTQNITAEESRATSAETSISNSLNAEISRSTTQDNNLWTAASTEQQARINGDTAINNDLTAHKNNTSNPHSVTKAQVGLSDVDNKSEATIKSDFTGSIAQGNTGFVTGGDAYNAFQAAGKVDDVKLNGTTVVTNKIANINTIDNVTSTVLDPLSAKQGKLLSDRISNLETLGRFLSVWNCTTGLPETEPGVSPYLYKTGDYYRIGQVGTTNYKPNGDRYITGTPSTTVETGTVHSGDIYYYDSAVWTLMPTHSGDFVSEVKVNGTSVVSSGVANINAIPASIVTGQLTDSQISSATTWSGKQDAITSSNKLSADYISDGVTNKTVTQTEKTSWTGKQPMITSTNKLSSDLVDDTGHTNLFVTNSEKVSWNNKQNAIIPSNKLSSDLVDDTNHINKFVTSTDKTNWNSKVGSLSDLGITATATELNYTDGVTSNIQTQLNGKQPSGSYVTTNTEQTITEKKTILITEPIIRGGQTTALNVLSTHTSEEMDSMWAGRMKIGNKNKTFLLGVYKQDIMGQPAICGIGAHSWEDSEMETGAAWEDIYLNPDGNKAVYIGSHNWIADTGWFKVQNTGNDYNGKAYCNRGSITYPDWHEVATIYDDSAYSENETWSSNKLTTQFGYKENISNKVTSISSGSTNTQYPSAKLLYDQLALKQNNLTVNPAATTANLTSIGINGTNYALAGGTQVIWRTY